MSKPYETEREARAAVAHITGPPGTGAWSDGNRQLLEDALPRRWRPARRL